MINSDSRIDPFDITPSEIGRIAAVYPAGMRACYITAMIAAKPYASGAMFQMAADRALLEVVRCEAIMVHGFIRRKSCGCVPGGVCADCF